MRTILFLLTLCIVVRVQAQIRPISDITTFQTMNNALSVSSTTPTAVRTVVFRCPVANWGTTSTPYTVTDTQGRTTSVTVTCSPLSDRYTGSVVGYIPSSGRIQEFRVCSQMTTAAGDAGVDLLLLNRGKTVEKLREQNLFTPEHQLRLFESRDKAHQIRKDRVIRFFDTEADGYHPHFSLQDISSGINAPVPGATYVRQQALAGLASYFGLNSKLRYAAIAITGLTTISGQILPAFISHGLTDGIDTSGKIWSRTAVFTKGTSPITALKNNALTLAKRGVAIKIVTAANVAMSVASIVLDVIGEQKKNEQLNDLLTALDQKIDKVSSSVNSLATSLDIYTNATATYFGSIQTWSGEVTSTLGDLASRINATNVLVGGVQQNLDRSVREQIEYSERQTLVVEQVASYISEVSDRTSLLNTRMLSLSSLVTQITEGNFAQLRSVLNAVTDVANQTSQNMLAIQATFADVGVQIDTLARTSARNAAFTSKAIANVAFDREPLNKLTYLVLASVSMANVNYTIDSWASFLTHYGIPPNHEAFQNADGFGDSYAGVESVVVRYISSQGSGLEAYQDTISIECSRWHLTNTAVQPIDVRDTMERIGPMSCAVNTTDPGCECRVRIRTTSCTLAIPSGSTAALTRAKFVVNGTLSSSVCAGGAAPSSTVQLIYNTTQVMSVLGNHCSRGVHPGLKVFVGSSLDQSSVLLSTRTPGCSIDYSSIENGTETETTVEYFILMRLFVGYGNAIVRSEVYSFYEFGLMPGGVTYRQSPTENDDGLLYKCWYAAFMQYRLRQTMILPVISYTRTSSTAAVVVSTDGISGTPVTEITVGSRSAAVIDSFVSVGYPDDDSIVYDIPQALLPITQNPVTRAGTVTYPMLPPARRNPFSAVTWTEIYGVPFDAYSGTVTADKFGYRTSPTTKLCTTPVSSDVQALPFDQDNSLCRMRQHGRFTRSSVGTNLTSFMSYTPTESGMFYDVAVSFPVGDISSVLYSGCPIMTVIKSSPIVTIVQLTNPVPSTILFSLEVVGACPDYKRISLVEGGSFQYQVPVCGNGDTGSSLVQIRRVLDDDTDDIDVCPGGSQDATVNRTAYIQDNGIPDTTYVQHSSAMVTNQAITSMLRSVDAMFRVTQELVKYSINVTIINGLASPQLNTSGMGILLDDLRNLTGSIANDEERYRIRINETVAEYNRRLKDLRDYNQVIAEAAANRSAAFWAAYEENQRALNQTNNKIVTVESLQRATQANFLYYVTAVADMARNITQFARDQDAVNKQISDIFWALNGGWQSAFSMFTYWFVSLMTFPINALFWWFLLRCCGLDRCLAFGRGNNNNGGGGGGGYNGPPVQIFTAAPEQRPLITTPNVRPSAPPLDSLREVKRMYDEADSDHEEGEKRKPRRMF